MRVKRAASYLLFQFILDVLNSDAFGMGRHHRFNGFQFPLWYGLYHVILSCA